MFSYARSGKRYNYKIAWARQTPSIGVCLAGAHECHMSSLEVDVTICAAMLRQDVCCCLCLQYLLGILRRNAPNESRLHIS